MTATIGAAPLLVAGWGNDEVWLSARNRGISASDVAAILGFSQYCTPWEVWAEKTGLRARSVDAGKECIQLGVSLEPWLLIQAHHHLGVPVVHTAARLYAHHDSRWQLASPDGEARPDDGLPFGVEAKTAGLAGGFGIPKGWSDDQIPLGYQFQAHWQMRVMGWRKVVVVALVANLGLRFYEIHRDLSTELDMVDQVTEWYERHIVGRVEPPIVARDNQLMDDIWPAANGGALRLDDDNDIVDLVFDYQRGSAQEKSGKELKENATAEIKRKLGNHYAGTINGQEVITWAERAGSVSWKNVAAALNADAGGTKDTLAAIAEPHRGAPSRSIKVKGIKP